MFRIIFPFTKSYLFVTYGEFHNPETDPSGGKVSDTEIKKERKETNKFPQKWTLCSLYNAQG